MSSISILNADDWQGLYVNGKLVAEDHMLEVSRVLDLLGVEHEWLSIDYAIQKRVFRLWDNRFPVNLSDVKREIQPGWPG